LRVFFPLAAPPVSIPFERCEFSRLAANIQPMRKRLGFWFVYTLAWVPLATSYVTFYAGHLGEPLDRAITKSLTGVLPAASLGALIVALCERLPWSRKRRVTLLAVHAILAVLCFELWMAGVRVFYLLEQKIDSLSRLSGSGSPFDAGMITGIIIYSTIAAIMYAMQATQRLGEEQARVAQLESLRTRAELDALRAQLNPHFLFNTLHSLMTLVRHDGKAAEDALEKLAMLLRHILMSSSQNADVTLVEEIDFIRDYLSLEQIRLGERLRVKENIQSNALDCTVPPLILQPLIENSIKHAIANQSNGGLLTINANRRNDILTLEILNDGPGTTCEAIAKSTGAGLRIARERLATRYTNTAKFQIDTRPGAGFTVRMELPINEREPRST
jgi:sensor histidine kinase YesM